MKHISQLDIGAVLCMATVIRVTTPRGVIWWCEDCWGGGTITMRKLEPVPTGRHRKGCVLYSSSGTVI